MNTKYSNWKMWYYVLCMVLTLQLAACSEERMTSILRLLK